MSDRCSESFEVLLVEDDPEDGQLIRTAFEDLAIEVTVTVTTDGDDGLDVLSKRLEDSTATVPDLVLLDLELTRRSGLEFLETIKDDATFVRVPVIVLADSDAPADIRESYELAANAYLTKPTDADEFTTMVETVAEFWFEQVLLPSTYA